MKNIKEKETPQSNTVQETLNKKHDRTENKMKQEKETWNVQESTNFADT